MPVSRRQFLLATGSMGLAASGPSWAKSAPKAVAPATFRPDDWASVRAQFRLSPDFVHLSPFYIVSHPRPVRDAIEKYRKALDENPFGYLEAHMFEKEDEQLWRKVTVAAAEYLGGKPEEIALTGNTTTGLALLYNGLRLKKGQEILVTTHDHYVHHEAVRMAAEKWGASTRRVPLYDEGASVSVDECVSRLKAAIRPETRVVGLTWVHSSTGVRLPIKPLAAVVTEANRNRDAADRALLILDGVHGLGAVDETAAELGVDFFVAGTHKWIFAPRGTGLIWGRPQAWAHVQPTIPTFMNFEPYQAWQDQRPPQGPTQASWISPGGFFAYEHQWASVEAFNFHKQIGRARIAGRIATLNGLIKEGLSTIKGVTVHTPRDAALSGGVNVFEVAGMKHDDVVKKLLEQKIVASTAPYKANYPRLSAGIMNSESDVERAVKAVRALT